MQQELIRKVLLLLFVFVASVILGFAHYTSSQARSADDASIHSVRGAGLSIFFELLTRDRDASGEVLGAALLSQDQLDSYRTLGIFFPRFPLSSREQGILRSFVEQGNRLVVSFHDRLSQRFVESLLHGWEINQEIAPLDGFENGRTVTVRATKNEELFRAGEQYEFYSDHYLEGPECVTQREIECFARILPQGKGSILVFAGVPPLSNALIGRSSNSVLAFRLMDWGSPMLVDEYHHFFSEVTALDLFSDPAFLLPLLGIILSVVTYFLFGYSDFHERSLAEPTQEPMSRYHEHNEGIVRATLRRASPAASLDAHTEFLLRLFPSERDRIQSVVSGLPRNSARHLLRSGWKLLMLHRTLLTEKTQLRHD